MSLPEIKKNNKEFAKWWDRWVSRVRATRGWRWQPAQGNRDEKADQKIKNRDRKKVELPHALELLNRLPSEGNL